MLRLCNDTRIINKASMICYVTRNTKKVDREKVCGIQTITHFTSDLAKVKKLITGLFSLF